MPAKHIVPPKRHSLLMILVFGFVFTVTILGAAVYFTKGYYAKFMYEYENSRQERMDELSARSIKIEENPLIQKRLGKLVSKEVAIPKWGDQVISLHFERGDIHISLGKTDIVDFAK